MYRIILFLVNLGFFGIGAIDIEDSNKDVYFSSFIISMSSGEFYTKYRLPLVFYRQTEREQLYYDYKKNEELNFVTLKQREKEEEVFFKSKCSYPYFAMMREISNAYLSRTYLSWDTCSSLQKKTKQLEMSGQKNFIETQVQREKEQWKRYLVSGLENIIPLPLPQVISKGMAPGLSQYAKNHLPLVQNTILENGYLQSNLGLHIEDSSYPGISWANSLINDYNNIFYESSQSALNIKNLIHINEITLKHSFLGNHLNNLLMDPILKAFPAKTQILENKMILEEYRKSTNQIVSRIEGFSDEKKILQSIISCLESWPDWHTKNLRMAYYYGFYHEYGRDYNFSKDLRNNRELWNLVLAMDRKIYSSEIFQKRVKSLHSDCLFVKSKNPDWILNILDKEEEKHKKELLDR